VKLLLFLFVFMTKKVLVFCYEDFEPVSVVDILFFVVFGSTDVLFWRFHAGAVLW
jgi:hypothetical protein